jgi:hypothetical protein
LETELHLTREINVFILKRVWATAPSISAKSQKLA